MRGALRAINVGAGPEELTLKIGLHEGSRLAVTLNERLGYFGQTVNIASRVQRLAASRSILATEPVVSDPRTAQLLERRGLAPVAHDQVLKGIPESYRVYEIP